MRRRRQPFRRKNRRRRKDSEKLRRSEENYRDFGDELKGLSARSDKLRKKLFELNRKGCDISREEQELDRLDEERAAGGPHMDNDRANRLLERFGRVESALLEKEKKGKDAKAALEEEEDARNARETVEEYGSGRDTERGRELYERYREAQEPARKKEAYRELRSLRSRVLYGSMRWLEYMVEFHESRKLRYKNTARAEYWKKEARQALSRRDREALSSAVGELQDLRIFDGEEEGAKDLADIRLI